MIKCLTFICCTLTLPLHAQNPTGEELLNKAIGYHDPLNQWSKAGMRGYIEQTLPDKTSSQVSFEFKNGGDYFAYAKTTEGNKVERVVNGNVCTHKVNGSEDLSDKQIEENRLSCERTQRIRNYYVYLYGLPMKLKDPGTFVDEQVTTVQFLEREYLRLKVTYDSSVGNDTWYFYFNPETYGMEAYQFYHDESKNDGEYITLSEIIDFQGIKIPKTRSWYINKDDAFLATDDLIKLEPLD